MVKIIITLGLLLGLYSNCNAYCSAQRLPNWLPDAPTTNVTKTEWGLLAVDAGFRALDAYSTHAFQSTPGEREQNLPGWVAYHNGVMWAYSGGIVTGEYFLIKHLNKNHPKWAKFIPVIDTAIVAPWAVHNMTILRNARNTQERRLDVR